ncbi:MAG: MBL fold metallo-hydrolase [Acidobacteriota bacterium]|nr:MBL fold metallo-hydrolase [Acidobacteriota bacterium]
MELYKNVYQINSLFGGRNLFQYLFRGEKTVLVDTGISETPERVIFPYMERLGLAPEDLKLSVTTHADLDHQGGNDSIKRQSPGTWLACGEADREMIENPQALYNLRYNFLREGHGVGFDPQASPQAGSPRVMDISFSGGEKIWLGDSWELEVLLVPGHSRGHLALYDRKHKTAFVGDAIHGRGCPKAEGGMAIPVTYFYVDLYLSTLRYFESLPIDRLYSGHWPTMQGEEIRDFISESRQTVELIDRVILANLSKQPKGLSLRELIDCVSNAIGDWPKEGWELAMFSVKGHMDRLEELNKVRRAQGDRPIHWQAL